MRCEVSRIEAGEGAIKQKSLRTEFCIWIECSSPVEAYEKETGL